MNSRNADMIHERIKYNLHCYKDKHRQANEFFYGQSEFKTSQIYS